MSSTGARFGYEWDRYAELLPAYEEQFRRWLPFFAPGDWRGLRFLDVGCGMGRNSYWPMRDGAASCTAIDIDDRSLAAARRTLAPFPTAEVRKQSAYDLPDADVAAYDVVFSIGVVHHLDEPERALGAMARACKPDGKVCIWVYGFENNERLVAYFDPLRRALLGRLPLPLVHLLSLPPSAGLFAALRLGLGRGPYLELMRGFSFPHLRSIVFDQMLPPVARYYRRHEVEALMASAGLRDVELRWVNEMSWAAMGRPGTASA